MRSYKVAASYLKGTIDIPSSKSHTLRALLFASLAKGTSTIRSALVSDDASSMIEACKLFGANINKKHEQITIHGIGEKPLLTSDVINAGNSGIVLRFLTAIGATGRHPVVITGDASLRSQRPMKPLLDALGQRAVFVQSMRGDGFAPIIVQGPLQPGPISVFGEDSQHVSALLIASAIKEGPTTLSVLQPGEKPWVLLTLSWFDRLGIPYVQQDFSCYHIPGSSRLHGFEYTVPGDFSSAAIVIAAALITRSEIRLKNLDMTDCQGDKQLVSIFQKMGADIEVLEDEIIVRKRHVLFGHTIDVNDCIDGVIVLAALACFAESETRLYNASIARHKECNRLFCITSELRKMGANIEETDDGLTIRPSTLTGCRNLSSYGDHRMAMCLAAAAMGCDEPSQIFGTECVAKTFPTFVRDMRKLGASLSEVS